MNRTSNSHFFNSRLASQQVIAPRTIPVFAPNRIEARERVRVRAARQQKMYRSQLVFFVVLAALTFMFCITLNLKMQFEVHDELQQQSVLRSEIEQLQNVNSAIAREIDQLQNNSVMIERAARERLKMVRTNERIVVPARKL